MVRRVAIDPRPEVTELERESDHFALPPVVDFFNHVNMLYGTITEFCNPQKASFVVAHVEALC
jgi:hypothetical protein